MGSVRGSCPRARCRPLSSRAISTSDHPGWRVLERQAPTAVLHGERPDPLGSRLACVCLPADRAVVIGSAQPAADFDLERLDAAGLGLVPRRSGGGAVLVAPGRQVWVDVFLPTSDVLAEPDVGKSFLWLGDAFARAIAKVLGTSTEDARVAVCRAPVRGMPWSKVLCYAGLGAGEVTVAGRKVVGMSQRRDRSGAWIQAMALLDDDAAELADLLAGSAEHRAEARAVLEHAGLRRPEPPVGPLGPLGPLVASLTTELLSFLP